MEGVLVIVPCGQGKIWDHDPQRGPAPAREAYTGAPFKVNREYAEHFGEQWVILSAKYGFIPPGFLIPGPYNITFKKPSTGPVSLATVRQQIQEQHLGRFSTVVGLGGKEYRAMVAQAFAGLPVTLRFPFAGLGIGLMMQATKRAIELDQIAPEQH